MNLHERRKQLKQAIIERPDVVEPRYATCVSMEVSGESSWMAPVTGTIASGLLYCESNGQVELSFTKGDVREVIEFELKPKELMSFGGSKVNLEAGSIVKMKVSGTSRPVLGSFIFLVT